MSVQLQNFHCIVAEIYHFHIPTHTHMHVRYHGFYDACFFTLSPPFHVALPFLASPCALVGGKQSAGILSDPRFDQTCASALGSSSGGRWALARPPAGAARRSQWPRDPLCRHSEAWLRSLSGKIVLLAMLHLTGVPFNSLKKLLEFDFLSRLKELM